MDWKKTWSFVTGNNFFIIVLGVLLFVAYQRFAHRPEIGPSIGSKPSLVAEAETPKYVIDLMKRMEVMGKPQVIVLPSGQPVAVLPKEELEKKRPGSVTREVLKDNTAQVTARAEIPPSKGKTQVDAIGRIGLDNVYKIHLDYRQLPPHWYELKKEYHIGVGYGLAGPNMLEGWARAYPLRLWEFEGYAEARVGMEREGGRFNGQVTIGVQY